MIPSGSQEVSRLLVSVSTQLHALQVRGRLLLHQKLYITVFPEIKAIFLKVPIVSELVT